MGFDVLTIRTPDQGDGAMYPVIGGGQWPIELEEIDGMDIELLDATVLAVGEVSGSGIRPLRRFCQIKADVLITDSRVAIACSRFDKGAGASVLALGLTAISKVRPSDRRRGKMLVGHVRFPWLLKVGACPCQGVRGDQQLRLVLGDSWGCSDRLLALDVTLARHVDSLQVAQTIAQRAARFCLEHTAVADEYVETFQNLTCAERLVSESKQFAMYAMPTCRSDS
jgi:hypothetical protein